MSWDKRQLAAYVRQLPGSDPAFEDLVVGFFLAFREELVVDVRADDVAGLFALICRCLDLDRGGEHG